MNDSACWEDPIKSSHRNFSGQKRRSQQTFCGRVALLFRKDNPDSGQKRLIKPTSFLGTLAFLFDTDKKTIRGFLFIGIVIILVILAALYLRSQSSRDTNYWQTERGFSEFNFNELKRLAEEKYQSLPAARKKEIKNNLRKFNVDEEKAQDLYRSLPETEKKTVNKVLQEALIDGK